MAEKVFDRDRDLRLMLQPFIGGGSGHGFAVVEMELEVSKSDTRLFETSPQFLHVHRNDHC